jgi:hypothetical protein
VLALVELALHARFPNLRSDDRLYRPDARVGWTHVPGAQGYQSLYPYYSTEVKISSSGLRDYEYPPTPPAGTTRVLILGDSLTEAMQVPLDQTYPKVLERPLNAGGPNQGRYKVLNAAVGGYSTDSKLLYYMYYGRMFHPDIVILQLGANHEPLDNLSQRNAIGVGPGISKPYFLLKDGLLALENFPPELPPVTPPDRFRSLLDHISDKVRLYVLIQRLRWSHARALMSALHRQDNVLFAPGSEPEYLRILHSPYDRDVENAWTLTDPLIGRLNEQVRSEGAKLAILELPFSTTAAHWCDLQYGDANGIGERVVDGGAASPTV